MKLSVIICVYNTPREYLDKCLSSITNSTLSLGEYEICIVDDGSSEDYSDLVRKYGAVYRKHENQGILYSRICGIEMAKGDYVTFVDSDDTVSGNYHYPMLTKSDGADIVVNDWAFHTEKCKYFCTTDDLISGDVSKFGDDVLAFFLAGEGRQHSRFVLWNKAFRSDVIKRASESVKEISRLYPSYNYSEDALISFFAHKYAKSLKNIHTGYYFYRIHSAQSVSVVNKDRLISHIECMSRTLDIMYESSADHPDASSLLKNIESWRHLMSRTHYSYARSGGYSDLYPTVREKYKVEDLKKSTAEDGKYYIRVRVLPKNFDEIDRSIYNALLSEKASPISESNLQPYARMTVGFIKKNGGRVEFSTKGALIPKERCNILQTVIHSYPVSRIGLILFPKGSKIRAFLKKHI